MTTLPTGFGETTIASGLNSPTSIDIAHDGRVFIAQENGTIRVVENGNLLANPFAQLTVDGTGERGLLGITLDPNFDTNHYLYVFYTATTPASHNRVSRITADGDTMLAGSEKVLIDLPAIGTAPWRMGGAIHFGPDGKLYISAGDQMVSANAQTLDNPFGKILRINSDGTIPSDNPFYNQTIGVNQAIWAIGLRNPYTTAFQPGTGKFYLNDVGQSSWEEIDQGAAGANYGWPATEGAFNQAQNPGYTEPVYAYSHNNGTAITGGAFYNPQSVQFPRQYVNDYFFTDFGAGEIRVLDAATNTVSVFGSGASYPTNLAVTSDGAMYYVSRGIGTGVNATGDGKVVKITYSQPQQTGGTTYLSNMPTVDAVTNGWGPMERDKSNGEKKANDGHTIKLNGVSYAKGLGVHANSSVSFNLGGNYTQFMADIGVDDEVGNNGNVQFQVWGDGVPLYNGSKMTGASATGHVAVNVTGVQTLKLVVLPGASNIQYDHADWANARLMSGTGSGSGSGSGGGSSSSGGGGNPPPGTFALAAGVSYSTGTNTHGVATADVNGDGIPDLVSADSGINQVSVLIGKGDGSFKPAINYATGLEPKVVAVGDVNGDGKPDLVTANQNANSVSVLMNRGDGTFGAATSYAGTANPHDVALADFNGDGKLDIAQVGWGSATVRVFLNNGNGTFAAGKNYTVGKAPHSVVAVDLNGDGKADLAVADHNSNNVAVLLNQGKGTFGGSTYYSVGTKPHQIRAADLNGDGRLDLATVNDGSSNVSVLMNSGNGKFAKVVNYATGPVPKGIALGDVNGDGLVDIVTANTAGNYPSGNHPGGNTISVLLNVGGGKFGKPTTYTTGTTPFSVVLADFDGDGDLDIATADWDSNDVVVLKNKLK